MLYSMLTSKGAYMQQTTKARVFMSGRSQHVTIPAEYRFSGQEVYVRRDQQTGDLILSQAPGGWDAIYAALDDAGFPDDFLSDRAQGNAEVREEL
jgi:antitoxin VapB